MQARQLRLPPPPPSPRSPIRPATAPASPISLLLEPSSASLALMFPDASVLLYPSPFSASPPPTAVPPVSTASCFVRLSSTPSSPDSRVLFLSAAPRGLDVALRAWALRGEGFVRERLGLGKRAPGTEAELDLRHGFKLRMCGAVNVFALYSAAAGKVWVLGARVATECVEIMKCAVLDCDVPVYAIAISGGMMMLGEVGGVRIFPLRPLVKGKAEGKREVPRMGARGKGHAGSSSKGTVKGDLARDPQKKRLPNGLVPLQVGIAEGFSAAPPVNHAVRRLKEETAGMEQVVNNLEGGGEVVTMEQEPIKRRTLKIKQNTGYHGSSFVELKHLEIEQPETKTGSVSSIKAVAIHTLARRKFLIMDSIGDLHILSMQTAISTNVAAAATLKRVDSLMKVQMLAVLPDLSSESQIAWISDGLHSVHVASLTGMDESIAGNMDENKETPVQISVSDTIFTSEKIQDIVPFSANAVLTLAQGKLYVYATE